MQVSCLKFKSQFEPLTGMIDFYYYSDTAPGYYRFLAKLFFRFSQ